MPLKSETVFERDYDCFPADEVSPEEVQTGGADQSAENKSLSVTAPLKQEHDHIGRMMNVLASFCMKLDRREPIQVDDLDSIWDYLKIYVDARHNGKEESLLYPEFMAESGDREKKMIGSILGEHETERMYVNVIGRLIRHYRDAELNADTWLVVNLSKYITLQKEHMDKENTILFSIVENRLSARKKAGLLEAFKCADEIGFGAVRSDEFQGLLVSLEKNYQNPRLAGSH